jgi:hypothetical protein
MSGSLSARAPIAATSSAPNPLTAGARPSPRGGANGRTGLGNPASHAASGAQIASMGLSPKDLQREAETADYAVEMFRKLARDPDVTRPDVLKAAANAVSDRKTTAERAIALVSQVPDDPDHLGKWLRNLYGVNLTTAVHLKAQLLRAGVPILHGKPKRRRA